jgi:hypothetical protein
VTGIPEIHHALRNVNAIATHVHVAIDVELAHDLSGVNSHPHGEAAFDLFCQLTGAADRARRTLAPCRGRTVCG